MARATKKVNTPSAETAKTDSIKSSVPMPLGLQALRYTGEAAVGDFDPDKHLSFKSVPKTHTMASLKLRNGTGIVPFAVSEPFPLFTPEAIHRMRSEVLTEDVWDNCRFSSNLAASQLRGYADKFAPFVLDAWKNPQTLAIISKIAGIDLVPVMDYEIGHVNLSIKSVAQKTQELEASMATPRSDAKPVVDWHTDAYPFVCVLMLSDCSTMIGGETALRAGRGKIVKVRGPQMGSAVILQGRYIEHQALQALGATERITMVTSFRPRCPFTPDDTVLTTVRPVSDLDSLYSQFAEYRLEIVQARIAAQIKKLKKAKGKDLNLTEFKDFLGEQEEFLARTNHEMAENVTQGEIDDSHLLNGPKAFNTPWMSCHEMDARGENCITNHEISYVSSPSQTQPQLRILAPTPSRETYYLRQTPARTTRQHDVQRLPGPDEYRIGYAMSRGGDVDVEMQEAYGPDASCKAGVFSARCDQDVVMQDV